MANWEANLDALNLAIVDTGAFGEPVRLPNGSLVPGVFGKTPVPQSPWPEAGAPVRISGQINRHLDLLAADAARVNKRDLLVIRGAGYVVVDLDQPCDGLVRAHLMPEKVRAAPWSRWQ